MLELCGIAVKVAPVLARLRASLMKVYADKIADIELLAGVDFLAWVKQSVPEDCTHLKAWYERASAELA